MRSLPFRVICLLGMQDTAFPCREGRLEFDQMQLQPPHPADPQKGVMDRYLMLETLLCARDAMHISYTGRNIRDNSECQPSVLIEELLDQLRAQYEDDLVSNITYLHPMQPFSPDNYQQAACYDAYWCELANQISASRLNRQGGAWPELAVEVDLQDCDSVDIRKLSSFMKDPVKFFFHHTLSIYFQDHDERSDEEPFTLNGLEKWQVKKQMLDAALGLAVADKSRMSAQGMLPHGHLSDLVYAEQDQVIADCLSKLEPYSAVQPVSKIIAQAIPVGDGLVQLTGQVRNYFPGMGLLHVTPSKLASKYAMPFWIEHLALCANGCVAAGEKSVLICSDKTISLKLLAADDAREVLADYISALFEGMQYPLPLFEKSSWEQAVKGKVSEASWSGNAYNNINIPGDQDHPYVQMVMRDVSELPISSAPFMAWAERFYRPLLNVWAEEK